MPKKQVQRDHWSLRKHLKGGEEPTKVDVLDAIYAAKDKMSEYALSSPPVLRYLRESTIENMYQNGWDIAKIAPSMFHVKESADDSEGWIAVAVPNSIWDEYYQREANGTE